MIQSDYIAAVVEYEPINATFPNETVEANLAQYVYFIEHAQLSSVQIIVFPEYGLTGLADNASEYAIEIPNPTDNSIHFEHFWLEKLSNAAVAHSMYVVVNLLEKEKAEKNILYYNTDVVFDTKGRIVAKHRKVNLFQEPLLTPGNSEQNKNIFTTDFGVTFGVFTCADISFYNPAKTILSNPAVTDIIFPTAWGSFLPFFHSLSIQNAYTLASKVNLLAANLNSVENGMSGSGIYAADGTIISYYLSGKPGSKMQIATVKTTPTSETTVFDTYGYEPLNNTISTLDNLNTNRYFDSEKYVFKRLNISQLNIKEEVCHRSFCCAFSINVSSTALNASEIYQIMAYRGPARIGELRNLKFCSLVACKSSDLNTCGDRNIKLTSKLESVLVETNVLDEREGFYLPISLTGDLVPVFNTSYNSTAYKGARIYKYLASNIKQENILAFGIVANDGITLSFNSMLIVGILVLKHLLR